MTRFGEIARDVLQTAFRLAPWPTEVGLRRIGQPGPDSPVLVTCNYDLSVRRVRRALEGVDAWLVVAPSGGINVWCAAAGGLLGTHQIVTALKTSGVEQQVRHRRAVLPQLAATGVLSSEVSRRSGWRVRFGPVRAEDLPAYLATDGTKTEVMRRVRFAWRERLEMAVAWAAPTALILGLPTAMLKPEWALPLVALATCLAIGVFGILDRIPGPRRLIFSAGAAALALAAVAVAGGGAAALLTSSAASLGLSALLTFDYTGSTPIEGGSHFAERAWHIDLDLARCDGAYDCWEVCPAACFDKREDQRLVMLAHEERCVRCGACVVQCPMDALAFADASGTRIPPDTIRRFKLNLLGRRAVDAGADARPAP